MKPIIKWAGGKSRLLSTLKQFLPKFPGAYFEPFLGGGALAFDLAHEQANLSDINAELIEFYQIIRDNPEDFLSSISLWKNDEQTFYNVRALDRDINAYKTLSPIIRAARFYYLNKTCFNGLYRVGKKGFNTPWGHGKNVAINIENILSISQYLKRINLKLHGFEMLPMLMKAGDFVYCDPPYVPLNVDDECFSGYGVSFGIKEQTQLRDVCIKLREIGTTGMLSNSDTILTRELYKNFDIKIIEAPRKISAKSSNRKNVNEILVLW